MTIVQPFDFIPLFYSNSRFKATQLGRIAFAHELKTVSQKLTLTTYVFPSQVVRDRRVFFINWEMLELLEKAGG
jgi:hypothetical protein